MTSRMWWLAMIVSYVHVYEECMGFYWHKGLLPSVTLHILACFGGP